MTKIGKVAKEQMVRELSKELKGSPSIFITDCTGLSTSELTKLRNKLKPNKTSYMIIKNSMGKLSLKDIPNGDALLPYIEGTVGVAYGPDPAATSKVLIGFSKESGKLTVKGALMDGKLIGEQEIKTLSQLPSREVLLSRVFGGMKAPLSNMASVLRGIIREFVYVVHAVKEVKEKSSEQK